MHLKSNRKVFKNSRHNARVVAGWLYTGPSIKMHVFIELDVLNLLSNEMFSPCMEILFKI